MRDGLVLVGEGEERLEKMLADSRAEGGRQECASSDGGVSIMAKRNVPPRVGLSPAMTEWR